MCRQVKRRLNEALNNGVVSNNGQELARISMSRAGNCWDNVVAESFFHTLKTHIIHDYDYKTRELANKALFEYIEIYYNRAHRHSTNGWISPEQYEQLNYQSKKL